MFQLDLTGKRAWVTGGSRGIGKATCLALAQAGCDVAVGFHAAEVEATAVADAVRALGRSAITVGGDLSKPEVADALHQRVVAELGPIDVLVNNAGVIRDKLFLMLEPADWTAVLDANLGSCVNASRATIRGMWRRRSGRIINISSAAATRGGPGQVNYAASKGAIEALTRSLAVEVAPRGITVNCIAPGVIETEMTEAVIAAARDAILDRQLVKRFGRADEIAGWVTWLASSHCDFVTGQVVHVDGGLKMA